MSRVRRTVPERCYRLLLLLLPRRFRREAAPELLEVFRDGSAHAAERGRGALLRFWARMAADVLVTAVVERVRRAPTHGPPSSRTPAGGVMEGLCRDLRFSYLRLLRRPGHTLLAGGTLGLGVAASLVMITLVRDVLLRPLPLRESEQLVRLLEVSENSVFWPSFPNFRDWREHAHFFDGILAVGAPEERPVILGERSVRVSVGGLSRGALEILDVTPVVGRGFSHEEQRPGGEAVALVSWDFWHGTLGAAPLENLSFTLGEEVWRVVGVLPPDFRFLSTAGVWGDAAVWKPLEREEDLGGRGQHGYHVVARLAPGVSLDRARADMTVLADRLKEVHGEPSHADRVRLSPLLDEVVADVRQPLELLLVGALAVLLVACLNVAASLVAQGLRRKRELAIRSALGASRRGLAGQLLLESLMLAAPALLAGIALAWAGLHVVGRTAGSALPRLSAVALDPLDVAAAAAAALLAAAGAGLVPSLQALRRDLQVRSEGVGHRGPEGRSVWRAFVAGQVALTMVLLVAAGLLFRSFLAALSVDPGYETEGVLVVQITLPEALYGEAERRLTYYDEVLRRTEALPGVAAVGLTNVLPHESFTWAGTIGRPGSADQVWSSFRWVSSGYFEALGIPHLHGGALPAPHHDGAGVLIDRNLGEALWGADEDPVGDVIGGDTPVAGVTGSVRQWNQEKGIGALYTDYRAAPERLLSMYLLVRRTGGTAGGSALRSAVAGVDPLVPTEVRPLRAVEREELSGRRLMLGVAVGFAVLTLLLAAVGVSAVVSFAVGQERRDSAVRLALGAHPAALTRRLVVQGMLPVAVGTVLGLGAAVPGAAALESQLFRVQPLDPTVLVGGAALMFALALMAAWLPARRIERVDPAVALAE